MHHRLLQNFLLECHPFEFFTVYTKLAEMAVLPSKDLTTVKKVTSNGARPGARDYYWFKSPHASWTPTFSADFVKTN